MLTFKRIIKLIIFIGIVFIINEILIFTQEPKNTTVKVMWRTFYQEKNLDTLFVGSSLCMNSLNPYIINDRLEINSFNMGTIAQSLEQTHIGIEEGVKNHKIKTVVLVIGHFTFTQKNTLNMDIQFINAKLENKNIKEKLKEKIKFIFSKEHIKNIESINYFFPWIYDNIGFTPKTVLENIKIKINNRGISENEIYKKQGWNYIGKGFSVYDKSHDYNKVGNNISNSIYSKENYLKNFEILERISEVCKKRNIDLIIVNTPHPVYDILGYDENYFLTMNEIEKFFKKLRIPYYDFNLIKTVIFKSNEDYFKDFEHLNQKGATEFSKAFAKFMKLREKGEDMEKYFYTPEEYLESIKHISIVNFDTENREKGINILAKAYTGSKVNVEYEMLAYNESLNKYEVIREYDKNPQCFYLVNENKKYKIRVNARQVGTNVSYERYYEKEIEFRR